MEIERGQVAERPFARQVYKTFKQRFTGDLIIEDQGAVYKTSWEDGRVVAAVSPATTDSLARVALNAGLATSTLLGRFLGEVKRQPRRDELEIFAELARLRPEQTLHLKRLLLAQRAMRQYALPNGTLILNNARSMSADAEVPPIDPRWLIFHGVKTHYQLTRLEREMSPVFGHRLRIAQDSVHALDAFGFSPVESAIVHQLAQPVSTDELIAATTELDRAAVLSVVYSLVACDCLEPAGSAPQTQSNPLTAPAARKISAEEIEAMRQARARPRSVAPPPVQKSATDGNASPKQRPRPRPSASTTNRRRRSTASATNSRWQRVSTGVNMTAVKLRPSDVRKLINEKANLVDEGADHFRVIGVPFNASDKEIRTSYFSLAKKLHPDRLAALGIEDENAEAQRVFAAINLAFGVLSDRRRIAEYRMSLESNLGAASGGSDDDIEQVAAAIFAAEEAFRLGEMALRRNHLSDAIANFSKAVELNPDEGEHHAFLAWSVFCEAHDKRTVMSKVNAGLSKATQISPNNPMPYLLSGHVARQTGDDGRAERYYRKVLSLDPQNSDAQMQLRLLSKR